MDEIAPSVLIISQRWRLCASFFPQIRRQGTLFDHAPQLAVVPEDVHLIPVGTDYERLLLPLTRGTLSADEIVLYGSTRERSPESELADELLGRLAYTFETVLGLPVTIREIDAIYEFREAYLSAYDVITAVLDDGNAAWINISSIPRPVAFAFATAAHTIVVERPAVRDQVHTYYVSPEEYYAPRMLEELERQAEFFASLDDETPGIEPRRQAVRELLSDVRERGFTAGAKRLNGTLHLELPLPPLASLRELEGRILEFVYDRGPFSSTSELARELAPHVAETPDESFRSKVQYNVSQLEANGYIERWEEGNRYVTALSTMGELWVEAH